MPLHPIETEVIALARQRSLNLATAESCTGGLVAHRLTNISGASDCFLGGIVAYGNSVKLQLLGVAPDTLRVHGAVSEETVREMALGARRVLGADLAVALSGIAGPGGGTPEKPVGLVYIAVAGPLGVRAERCQFTGDRAAVKDQSADRALEMLVEELNR